MSQPIRQRHCSACCASTAGWRTHLRPDRLGGDRYDGDLRKLRAQADDDADALRRLVTECKGVGDVGADIFFREVYPA
jgi:hypothetical protein